MPFSLTATAWAAFLAAACAAFVACAFVHRQRRRDARLESAEAAHRVSEERLRLALEATTEIVWDLDLRTDAVYQPRFAQVYGIPEEASPRKGSEVTAFMHPDDAATYGEVFAEIMSGKRDGFELEHRMRTGTGEYRWMLGRARVVARGPGGEPLRLVGTCVDVTERRRMLERLQIADRMVSVGTLAAGVAHEINNPLAFVCANLNFSLEELERAASPEASRDPAALLHTLEDCRIALREAVNGAQRVRRIVQDLRTLSRAGEERLVPIDVGRAVDTALHIARGDLQRRARVVTHVVDVPPVLGDEARVSQVFLNLLVNAAQAIPEGRPDANEVEITVAPVAGRVAVRFRDTGCGIPAANLKRIFDPFFTTKPVGVGTGLGLAISQRIVAALGGEIEVASEVGRGTTFTVTFPIAPRDALGAASERASAEGRARGLRVLVVDDEPLFCRSVIRMLAADHTVVAVEDPRDALRRIEDGERFDVVLSDVNMPGLSGVELHAAIGKVAPDLAGRMIFVTGGAFGTAAEFLLRMKGRVLEKPLDVAQVRAAIGEVLGPDARAPLRA